MKVNDGDFPGENKLVRELKEMAAKRPSYETMATPGKGVMALLGGCSVSEATI